MGEKIIQDFVKSITDYNPRIKSNARLRDDFRLLAAYYSSKKDGKTITIGRVTVSLEDIVNTAKLIYDEIEKRKKGGTMTHEWNPAEMKPAARELFDKVSSGEILEMEEAELLKDTVSMHIQEDIVIMKDAVCLVGSTLGEKEANDIDILLRLEDDCSYVSRAVKTRLYKLFPDVIAEKLHIFHEPSGAHDDYIPLFDLVLKRREPMRVEMAQGIEPFKPFLPIKTTQQTFYNIPDLLEACFP